MVLFHGGYKCIIQIMYKYTLSVTRQVRYSLSLPTTVTLLRNDISCLIFFSMGSGWIFSPLNRVITAELRREKRRKNIEESRIRRRGSEGKWEEGECIVSTVVLVFERIIFNTQTSITTDKNEKC